MNNDTEWQPIETAPKGAAIVYDAKKGVIPNAHILNNDYISAGDYYSNRLYNVTHWQPLPKPPETT